MSTSVLMKVNIQFHLPHQWRSVLPSRRRPITDRHLADDVAGKVTFAQSQDLLPPRFVGVTLGNCELNGTEVQEVLQR